MAVDMIEFYTTVGVDDGIKSRISPDKTSEIRLLIDGLDDHSDAVACIKALLNRYPEESVLDFCFQKLIDLRPESIGPSYHAWRNEVTSILESLRRNGIGTWEDVFRQKMRDTHPKVAMNLWPQPVKFESANP